MEPIIISNPYSQTVNEFFRLYWEESFRKYWFLFILIAAGLFWRVVFSALYESLLIAGIHLLIFAFIIFFVRYRFISTLRRNPAFESKRVLSVFTNRMEVEDESGAKGIFYFTDMLSVKPLKDHYRIRLMNKQVFWIPMSCFKNEADLDDFEEVLRGE